MIEIEGDFVRVRDELQTSGSVFVDIKGFVDEFPGFERYEMEEAREWFKRFDSSRKIESIRDTDGYVFIYETEIPHATFDIMNGDEKYCRGIVFSKEDLK